MAASVNILSCCTLNILSFRSSRLEVFCKKGVLGNFAKFTGKHLCQSLFGSAPKNTSGGCFWSLYFSILILIIIYVFVVTNRTSHSQMFFKTSVFRNFANFTGKHLCLSLFLIKLQAFSPANLLKRGSNAGIFQ